MLLLLIIAGIVLLGLAFLGGMLCLLCYLTSKSFWKHIQ